MRCEVVFLCLALAFAATGCAKVKAAVCLDMVPAPRPGAAPATASAKTADKPEKPAETAAKDQPPPPNEPEPEPEPAPEFTTSAAQEAFALPFAWEKSPNEPLSRTRAFLREMARDNGAYMKRGPEYFKAFAASENPRVTLLSCADSRVQPAALDATPENDMFTVRNLGNQVGNGLGGIQYGIDHLNTPLLFILGHTGCGAVKAAMSGTSGLADPIKRELATLRIGKKKGKTAVDDKQWREGVLRNVNDQVETALKTFAARVNAGQLTVIGAVYDFRNELGKGPGKLSIINVNGVTEAPRLKAFQEAVLAGVNLEATGPGSRKIVDPFERLSQVFAEHLHEQDGDEEEEAAPVKEVPLAPVQHEPGPMFSPTPPVPVPAPPAAPAAH